MFHITEQKRFGYDRMRKHTGDPRQIQHVFYAAVAERLSCTQAQKNLDLREVCAG